MEKIANLLNIGQKAIVKAFVNHKPKNSHHGGTSLVQLNGALLKLGLLVKSVPSKVDVSITEVTREFTSSVDILHDEHLKESNESDKLDQTKGGDGTKGGKSRGDIFKAGSRKINVSWDAGSSVCVDVSNNGKHTDTSVLNLNVSETVELGFVTVGNKVQRIKESKRSSGTEVVFEGHVGGNGGACGILAGGKGGGRGDKGGEDSRLHGE